jgi:hypothetical protein
MRQGVHLWVCHGFPMAAKELRFSPLSETELLPAEEEFFSRAKLAKRWDCSEKAVLRAEKRLGLRPYRLLRAIKYKLSDILRVESEATNKAPKKFTGLRPDQKAGLLRREREEAEKRSEIARLSQEYLRREEK